MYLVHSLFSHLCLKLFDLLSFSWDVELIMFFFQALPFYDIFLHPRLFCCLDIISYVCLDIFLHFYFFPNLLCSIRSNISSVIQSFLFGQSCVGFKTSFLTVTMVEFIIVNFSSVFIHLLSCVLTAWFILQLNSSVIIGFFRSRLSGFSQMVLDFLFLNFCFYMLFTIPFLEKTSWNFIFILMKYLMNIKVSETVDLTVLGWFEVNLIK